MHKVVAMVGDTILRSTMSEWLGRELNPLLPVSLFFFGFTSSGL